MEIITSIAGFLTTGGLATALGMLGSWMTKREERKNLMLTHQHESKMRELDLAESKQEHSQALALADKKVEQLQAEGDIAMEVADAQAFNTSQKFGNQKSGNAFVDGVRGLIRPLITVYLLGVATYLAIHISLLGNGLEQLSADELGLIFKSIVESLLLLMMTATTWWFGSRVSSKK